MKGISLEDLIKDVGSYSDEGIVFAEKQNGLFEASSLTEVLVLTDAELAKPVNEVAEARCPGKEYFLEVDIVQGMLKDLSSNTAQEDLDSFVKRVIQYVVYDA